MTKTITCPNCGKRISFKDTRCEHCGVDVVMAMAVASRSISDQTQVLPETPIAPEVLVPRLGDYLVEKGLLESEQLEEALAFQKRQVRIKQPILLGQALIHLGYIDQPGLDKAVTNQIFELQAALKKSNEDLEIRVQTRTRELQQAIQRLTEYSDLKSNFVANISHELRTPLSHMLGYIDLLRDEALGPLNEDQKDAAMVLRKAYDRLANLIDDLIQFSMASQGDMMLNPGPAVAQPMIEQAIQKNKVFAEEQKVHITRRVFPDLPLILADTEKISWVIEQLIENGIKFNKPGGKVMVAAESNGSKVTLSVTDTGIGIPQQKINSIFEAFQQLDGSTTRRVGGTGLGLAMVKQIVEGHHSAVRVRSVVGKGSRFEFDLEVMEESNGN